jgi:hypothetical protein
MYEYTALGLSIQSEVELPELSAAPDRYSYGRLTVRLGQVSANMKEFMGEGDWLCVDNGVAAVKVGNAGWLSVEGGADIVLEVSSPERLDEVRLWIAGTMLPIAALQHGMIPLHVSAVRVGGGIHVFAGDSGAGKSTLASALQTYCNAVILTDDIAVFNPKNISGASGDIGRLHFGVNRIKLWRDSAELLGQEANAVKLDFFRPQKLHIAIESEPYVDASEIVSVVRLSWASDLEISRISNASKFELFANSVYPRKLVTSFLDVAGLRSDLLRLSSVGAGFQLARLAGADLRAVANLMNEIIFKNRKA